MKRHFYGIFAASIFAFALVVFLRASKEARPLPIVPPPAVLVKGDRLPVPPDAEPPPAPTPARPVATVRIEPPTEPAAAAPVAKPRSDPVCGGKGRTWYTRDNGWRYWRCNR